MRSLLASIVLILLVGCGPAPSPAAVATRSQATPTPGPASTPVFAFCQPSVGLGQGYVPTSTAETAGFIEQVRGAESALRSEPGAYQRYCFIASRVTGTFVCKQNLPKDVAAQANSQVYSLLGLKQTSLAINCAIEISQMAAFPEAKSRTELQRYLASVLSHESTHLALALDINWAWVVRFDKSWLDNAVKDELARLQASELSTAYSELERERASQYAEIDKEVAADLADAISNLRAQVDQRKREVLREYPNLSPSQRADVDRQLAEAFEQAKAAAERTINANARENKVRVDGAVAAARAETEVEARRVFKEMQEKNRVADYMKLFEESIVARPVSAQERDEVVRGECWAQHEERYTSTTIGGTSPEHGLELLLFLNSPECRKYLNLN